MLRVLAQITPEPTGETTMNKRTGEVIKWHRARLVEVGFAKDWKAAKAIHPYPIVEQVRDRRDH